MPEVFNSTTDSNDSKQNDGQSATSASSNSSAESNGSTKSTQSNESISPEAKDSSKQHHAKRSVDDYSDVMRYEKPTHNPLQAFATKPVNMFFDTQEKEEQIILLLRQSLITQIRWVLIALGMILFPFLFAGISPFGGIPTVYTSALLTLWYLMTFGYVLESFLSWFFNVYIITDERIIDVDFYSFIFKDVSNTKIINIEEVTAQTGGTLETIFNFGTVFIQTASATSRIEFNDVPQPSKVTRLLNELLLEEEQEKIDGRVQ